MGDARGVARAAELVETGGRPSRSRTLESPPATTSLRTPAAGASRGRLHGPSEPSRGHRPGGRRSGGAAGAPLETPQATGGALGEPRRHAGAGGGFRRLRPPRDRRGDEPRCGARGRLVGQGRALAGARGYRALRRGRILSSLSGRRRKNRRYRARRLRVGHREGVAQLAHLVHRARAGCPLGCGKDVRGVSENEPVRPQIGSDDASDPISKKRAWILVIVLLVIPGALYTAVPVVPFLPLTTTQKVGLSVGLVVARSEERRVGKACRSRWSP